MRDRWLIMNGSSKKHNSLLEDLQDSIKQENEIDYNIIENHFIQNKSQIDKVATSANGSLDQAFLCCLFHHTGTKKLDEENFSSALIKYLGDKKMMEFKSIQEIKYFINDNFMFFEGIDYFEALSEEFNHITSGFSSRESKISIFNNVYLFGGLAIDDIDEIEHVLNKKEPNPIHDFQVEFDGELYNIYFSNNSKVILRISVKNEEQKEQIIKNLNKFDEVSKNNRQKDFYGLEIEIDNMENNMILLFNNFVSEIPRTYFLSRQSHRIIEYTILNKAYLKELLFEAPIGGFKYALNYYTSRQPEGSIDYLNGIFDKLEKILNRQMDIDSNLFPAFMWMALRKQAIRYYANEWEEQFGIYFKKIGGDYKDLIKSYCEIQEINILEEENISLLTCFLMNKKVLPAVEGPDYYDKHQSFVKSEVESLNEIIALEKFERKLMKNPITKKMDFNDIDLLSGYEFEEFIEELFTKMGYLSTRTKASGDQGIDVLAEKDGRKFGIQTKCYGSKVNNSAVQETVAGIAYYNCDRGIVITNNYFTKSAEDLASKNNIILWGRNILREKFDEFM